MNPLLTVKEVAEILKVHPNSVYKGIINGDIPACKLPGIGIRLRRQVLHNWLDKGNIKSNPILEFLPKLDISLDRYDKLALKGGGAVSKKKQRWNYGKKGVYKRKLRSGYSWCYWYYNENGKIKKVTVPNATCREDVIIIMERKVREVFNKLHGLKKLITFRDFSQIYLEKYAKSKKSSWKTDEKYIRSRLIPFFGDMELTAITPEYISDFISNFKPKVKHLEAIKGSTINKHLQVLSKMFNLAEEFGYDVAKNPVRRKIHFAKETKYRRTRVLAHDEEERLMKEASPHLRPIIQCALLQLLRLKEILQLRVEDLDLGSSIETITIRPEINKSGNCDVIPIRPKMKPIFKKLIEENSGRSEFVFNYYDRRTGDYRPIMSCQHAFVAARKRAKIEGLEFRDLRRTGATRLHENQVDPLIIQRLLRHSSFKISEEVYIQSNLKMMGEVLNKLDRDSCKSSLPETVWNKNGTQSLKKKDKMPATCLFSIN